MPRPRSLLADIAVELRAIRELLEAADERAVKAKPVKAVKKAT